MWWIDEGADHIDAHFDGLRAVEDIGCHQRAVLGEGVGKGAGKFEAREVVAICDHLGFFRSGDLKHEVLGGSIRVALDLIIEAFGRHALKSSEVGIKNHLLLAYGENERIKRQAGFHGNRMLLLEGKARL